MDPMNRGLFLGRFQPLHKGHLAAIREAARKVDELYVGIGSANESGTERNPFPVSDRRKMIEAATPDLANIKIIEVPDIPGHDDEWVKYLEDRYPKFDVIFTGNPFTEELFGQKGYPVTTVTMVPDVSGTKIRELIGTKGDWQSLVPEVVVEIVAHSTPSQKARLSGSSTGQKEV